MKVSQLLNHAFTRCIVWTLALLIAVPPALLAHQETQQQTLSKRIKEAESLYDRGKFDQSIQILENLVKPGGGLSVEQSQQAYELLAANYVAKTLIVKAEVALKRLLELVPNYKPDPEKYDAVFVEQVEKVRKQQSEEQAKRLAEEQARQDEEEAAKKLAEEKAKKQAEEAAKKLAEEQARQQAEEQARKQAEEQAKKDAEEQAKRQAEDLAKKQTEEQAKKTPEKSFQEPLEEKSWYQKTWVWIAGGAVAVGVALYLILQPPPPAGELPGPPALPQASLRKD
jgi:flagellar biosynthesis GTPase FlhF